MTSTSSTGSGIMSSMSLHAGVDLSEAGTEIRKGRQNLGVMVSVCKQFEFVINQ